ncbi:hypothetical protein QA612_04540 [Evansella sp. AB-P1]|uniref:hypothetical protein n=1 Tax=Evansella sp. AB-P1 TaxID=3037653 RepID=UPI00241F75CB|nr:hypothetical protein [Evansella sp. AB-P1]MDG5786749.1 hypothetical protein [Evansella sp. AB-P1]
MRKFTWTAIISVFILGGIAFFLEQSISTTTENEIIHKNSTSNNTVNDTIILNNEITNKDNHHSESTIISEDELLNTYKDKLVLLEMDIKQNINNFISNAISDFEQYTNEGERPSVFHLYQTYYRGGISLIEETESRYQNKYENLKSEINSNGFEEDILLEFEEAFDDVKRRNVSEAINNIIDYFSLDDGTFRFL